MVPVAVVGTSSGCPPCGARILQITLADDDDSPTQTLPDVLWHSRQTLKSHGMQQKKSMPELSALPQTPQETPQEPIFGDAWPSAMTLTKPWNSLFVGWSFVAVAPARLVTVAGAGEAPSASWLGSAAAAVGEVFMP